MKRLLLPFLCFILTGASLAQNTTPSVQIAVDEEIPLKLESVTVELNVESRYSQAEEASLERFGWDGMYDWEGMEADYEYELMMEESPKKVTKEMKREYEERQIAREQREKEIMEFEMSFRPYTTKSLMDLLETKNVTFELETSEGYDYYEEFGNDSTLKIVVTSQEEIDAIEGIIEAKPVDFSLDDYKYESGDSFYLSAIPKLTEKARKQGEAIAVSLGKKLGDVIEVSNLYPDNYSYSTIEDYEGYDYYDDYYDGYYGYMDSKPFENTRNQRMRLVFRFKLENR